MSISTRTEAADCQYLATVREVDWMDLIHRGHQSPRMKKAVAAFLEAEGGDRDSRFVAAGRPD